MNAIDSLRRSVGSNPTLSANLYFDPFRFQRFTKRVRTGSNINDTMRFYPARWSDSLRITSVVITVVMVGGSLAVAFFIHGGTSWIGVLPALILIASAPFAIRGYTLTTDAILVHRLFWITRLPLALLKSVRYEPEAMRGSMRIIGNGGLFTIAGIFRNKTLGTYRAFVTHPEHTVVLVFSARTVVLSPSAPEDFVQAVRETTAQPPAPRVHGEVGPPKKGREFGP